MNRKGLSPLIATVLLVVFALIIGAVTMAWGNSYVENFSEEETDYQASIVIGISQINTPLKELQIKYITDQITLEEYLSEEVEILS